MKKMGVVIAIAALVTAFAVIGCATSGGGGGGRVDPNARFVVDLSTLEATRNPEAFTRIYDVWKVPFPQFPVDVTQFRNVTIRARSFDANGEEITSWGANAQVKIVMDLDGDFGTGPNVIVHEVNVGNEGLGAMSSDSGVLTLMGRLPTMPQGFIIQNSSADVVFIELTSIIFHNGRATPPPDPVNFVSNYLPPFQARFVNNFQYGTGWQFIYERPELLAGKIVQEGEEYILKVTYTPSRDLDAPIAVNIQNKLANPWTSLSFINTERPSDEEIEAGATVDESVGRGVGDAALPIAKAGETVTAEVRLTIRRNGGRGPSGNAFIFEESPGLQRSGPVTIDFTEFVLTRVGAE